VQLTDLKNRVENLKMLIAAIDADLARESQAQQATAFTEAWLMTLRDRLEEVEQDTEEAFLERREIVTLLVDRITGGRDEEGRTTVSVTYRFAPPETEYVAYGERHTKESILAQAETRMEHSWEEEVEVALGEIAKFASLRLEDLVETDFEQRW
jgi:hypothetical protein